MFEKMDSFVRPWEDALKIPAGETSRQWTPEAIAYLLELPFDNLIDTFGAKVGKFIAGFILAVAPQFAGPALAGGAWSTRDTEDIHAIAKHLIAEGLDPTASDLTKIAETIGNLRQGITYGDWSSIARVFGLKPIDQIKAEWENVGRSFARVFGIPSAPAAPAPPTAPPAAPVYPAVAPVTIEIPGFG